MPFENIVGRGENANNQHISAFTTMFPTLPEQKFTLETVFTFLSANATDFVIWKRDKTHCVCLWI